MSDTVLCIFPANGRLFVDSAEYRERNHLNKIFLWTSSDA
jgi:hypothetical protein